MPEVILGSQSVAEKGGLESHKPRQVREEATHFPEVLGELTKADRAGNQEI